MLLNPFTVSKLILEFILSKLHKDYLINLRDISKLYYNNLFYVR